MIGNAEKKIVDDVVECNVIESDIVETLKQIKTDIQENYEQFESIIESDINHLDDKTSLLTRELEDTKKELTETKRVVEDLKDQLKWMHKLFYHKVKVLESDLRDDFKEFVETEITNKNKINKSRVRR
jgi:septal ring factor EnvC (AmiA/AmiB activator)